MVGNFSSIIIIVSFVWKKDKMNNRFLKKIGIRIFLITLSGLGILFVPLNSDFVYGYGSSSPVTSSTGSSSVLANDTTATPHCGRSQPKAPVLYQPGHALLPRTDEAGKIRLNWLKVDGANKYTIAYGLSSGNYIYGLPDVGDTDNFTVEYLSPGVKYFFAVRANNDCMPGPWSQEWSAIVNGRNNIIFTEKVNRTEPVEYNIPLPSVSDVQVQSGQPVQQPIQQQSSSNTNQIKKPSNNTTQLNIQLPAKTQTQITQPNIFQLIWNFITAPFRKK